MKVEVKEIEVKKETLTFPRLMINGVNQLVLFEKESVGVIIVDLDEPNKARFNYETSWVFDEFTDFNGTITLSND